MVDEDTVRTARETASHSNDTPVWSNSSGFEADVFTFARVLFSTGRTPSLDTAATSGGFAGWVRGLRLGWWVDYPDADLNFSYRLQQMTSVKTDADGRVIRLTDPALIDYPLVLMEHPGYMILHDDEVTALQKYLLNGGALEVLDFWGDREWQGFENQIQRVLPGRGWVDLPLDHPIFHSVYEIKGPMNRLQVPTIHFWNRDYDPRDPNSHLQNVNRGVDYETVHVRAWLDDKGRIMIIAVHNSDVPDGWEREGEDEEYFRQFSEVTSYPLGINILVYLMTH
jgi:hypothetical protein